MHTCALSITNYVAGLQLTEKALETSKFIHDHLTNIPFTYGVICETLRLQPVEPFWGAQVASAAMGVKLRSDIHFRPEDEIVISVDALCRNEDVSGVFAVLLCYCVTVVFVRVF